MMIDDIYYPDGGGRNGQNKNKADFYLSIQHSNVKLNRLPLTASGYGDFLRNLRDIGESSRPKYLWIETVNSDRYIVSREVLTGGIVKIEKAWKNSET